jgi:hypothetical protein
MAPEDGSVCYPYGVHRGLALFLGEHRAGWEEARLARHQRLGLPWWSDNPGPGALARTTLQSAGRIEGGREEIEDSIEDGRPFQGLQARILRSNHPAPALLAIASLHGTQGVAIAAIDDALILGEQRAGLTSQLASITRTQSKEGRPAP